MVKTTQVQREVQPVIIIGGGGHTRVLIDVMQSLQLAIDGIVTRDETLLGSRVMGVNVRCLEKDFDAPSTEILMVNGVGNKASRGDSGLDVRAAVTQRYLAKGFRFASILSPHAIISPHAILAQGVQILHRALVQAGAHIGEGAIINSAAVIEHDVSIGANVHVAPAAVICGGARIGTHSHIGANATILQGVSIGERCVIAAGSVVRADLGDGITHLG